MTSPRDDDRIAHITEACEQAATFVSGRSYDEFADDRMLQLALVKLVEIIGEAAKAVSPDTQAKHPDVPWSAAARTRDRLTHDYFEIDLDRLWSTVADDLPALLAALRAAPSPTEHPTWQGSDRHRGSARR